MRRNFTLAELDAELNEMQAGAYVQISREDYERLFGLNSAALGRVKSFARGHQCVASFADTAVLFRKHIAAAEVGQRHPEKRSI